MSKDHLFTAEELAIRPPSKRDGKITKEYQQWYYNTEQGRKQRTKAYYGESRVERTIAEADFEIKLLNKDAEISKLMGRIKRMGLFIKDLSENPTASKYMSKICNEVLIKEELV